MLTPDWANSVPIGPEVKRDVQLNPPPDDADLNEAAALGEDVAFTVCPGDQPEEYSKAFPSVKATTIEPNSSADKSLMAADCTR